MQTYYSGQAATGQTTIPRDPTNPIILLNPEVAPLTVPQENYFRQYYKVITLADLELLIGDMLTVQARLHGEGADPENMPRADYNLQEALKYNVPTGFVEDYPPMLDYLTQERYYSET